MQYGLLLFHHHINVAAKLSYLTTSWHVFHRLQSIQAALIGWNKCCCARTMHVDVSFLFCG